MTNKIEYLESLRGIAAIMVACYHFRLFGYFGSFIINSWIFVEFFFVLSGFVIALNYQYRISNIKDLINFQKKRFLRLYPLHFFTLILIIFLFFGEFLKEFFIGNIGNRPISDRFDLIELLANLLLVHNLILDKLTFNAPSWSISSEFYVYLLFSIIILFTKNEKNKIILFAIIISAISFYYLLNNSFDPKYGFIRCLYSFFLGVIIFNIYNINKIKFSSFVTYITILIIIYLLFNFKIIEEDINLNIIMPLIFSLLILSLVSSEENIIKKILNNKHIIFLGTISYGIYMLHFPVGVYFNVFLNEINLYEKLLNHFVLDEKIYNEVIGIIKLIVTIFLAKYSYFFIEMKFYKK